MCGTSPVQYVDVVLPVFASRLSRAATDTCGAFALRASLAGGGGRVPHLSWLSGGLSGDFSGGLGWLSGGPPPLPTVGPLWRAYRWRERAYSWRVRTYGWPERAYCWQRGGGLLQGQWHHGDLLTHGQRSGPTAGGSEPTAGESGRLANANGSGPTAGEGGRSVQESPPIFCMSVGALLSPPGRTASRERGCRGGLGHRAP